MACALSKGLHLSQYPLAGMTLAQMGGEVIRFDRLRGGLDAGRWPLTQRTKPCFGMV